MGNKRVPEVRFEEFSGEWEESRLSDIVKLFGGNAFSSSDSSSFGSPWLKIANVGINGIDWSASSYLPDEFWTSYKDFRLYKGDYVMALTRPILNHILKISIVDKKALLNQRVAKLIFATNAEYGYQLLQRRTVVDKIENELAGTDPPNLGSGNLKNIDISITFNKDEQSKIGKFLNQLDDTIALHHQELTTLKQTKQGLMQKMFPKEGESVPEVRFPGFTGDWKQRKLGDNVKFYSGLTYTPDNIIENGTLVLRSSNIKNGEIVNADNVYVDPKAINSQNVEIGDVIVVVRNGSRNLIGKHSTVKKKMDNTVIGAFMTGIRSKLPSFTNALLDSEQFAIEINKNLGATINQITTGNFKKMNFTFPSIDEQEKIGNFFKQLDDTIALHKNELDALKETKKAFLQKMFV